MNFNELFVPFSSFLLSFSFVEAAFAERPAFAACGSLRLEPKAAHGVQDMQ